MQSTTRMKYLDVSKGLGVLLIMYGHITYIDNPVDTWMSSFKIVIFYVIAGYLLNYKDTIEKTKFKDFVLKLIRTLIIPYFFI